jgi:hypothetical protein
MDPQALPGSITMLLDASYTYLSFFLLLLLIVTFVRRSHR